MPDNSLRRFLFRHDARLQTLSRAGCVLCVVAVTVLSLLPQSVMPKIDLSDKVSHFIAYTAIGVSGLIGWRTAAMRIAVGGILLGGAIEIAQMFVPGRSAELLDFVVDAIGIAVGLLLARFLLPLWADAGISASGRSSRG
jgi:VanZ family protein